MTTSRRLEAPGIYSLAVLGLEAQTIVPVGQAASGESLPPLNPGSGH